MLSFLWNRLASLVSTLLLVVILLALYGGYRYASHHQSDNDERTANKLAYLALLAQQPLILVAPDATEAAFERLGLTPHHHADYDPGRRFYVFDGNRVEIEVVQY